MTEAQVKCCVCEVTTMERSLVRLNPPDDEPGIWVCMSHRHLFGKRLMTTAQLQERLVAIKAHEPENKDAS